MMRDQRRVSENLSGKGRMTLGCGVKSNLADVREIAVDVLRGNDPDLYMRGVPALSLVPTGSTDGTRCDQMPKNGEQHSLK